MKAKRKPAKRKPVPPKTETLADVQRNFDHLQALIDQAVARSASNPYARLLQPKAKR